MSSSPGWMSGAWSSLAWMVPGLAGTPWVPPARPPKVVLVPPFFQRDVRGLSRFCHSSYDYLANRKQLARLLTDHLTTDFRGTLLICPPEDQRVSVRAKLRQAGGSMVLRWQPTTSAALHTFVEVAASLDSPGDVSFRGSYLHPGSGLGAFVAAPLAKQLSGGAAEVGLRYSSPDLAAGAIVVPRTGQLHRVWLAGRVHGLTLGLQLSPDTPLTALAEAARAALSGPAFASPSPSPSPSPSTSTSAPGPSSSPAAAGPSPTSSAAAAAVASPSAAAAPSSSPHLGELGSWLRARSSLLLAYSPPPPSGSHGASFTAAVEVVEGRQLTFSFLQHMAATRQVVNPFEENEVVGITNYLDLGLQLTTSIGPATASASGPASSSAAGSDGKAAAAAHGTRRGSGGGCGGGGGAAAPASVNLAASWQINKNWIIKARVGSESAGAAVGVRAWHAVSAYLTANVLVDYATRKPKYGAELCVENWGPLRYERGADDVVAGRALLQRHEASGQDLANAAGQGVLVRRTSEAAPQLSALEAERRRVAELL